MASFAVWHRTGEGPRFNVGYQDGIRLRDMLGRGERVTVRLDMDSELIEGLRAASVWGTLPGTSEEEILIIAHMDGYFRSAPDNGSGLAVMMGLVEHYARRPQETRSRTIRFLGSVGHHERGLPAAMVGEREPGAARHRARRLQPIQRGNHWRHGSWSIRGDGADRPRCSVGPGDYLARDQAHRARHPSVDPSGRTRANRPRLRQDHRRRERRRTQGTRADVEVSNRVRSARAVMKQHARLLTRDYRAPASGTAPVTISSPSMNRDTTSVHLSENRW